MNHARPAIIAMPATGPTTAPAIQALLEFDSDVLVVEAPVWEGIGELARVRDWVDETVEVADEPRKYYQYGFQL